MSLAVKWQEYGKNTVPSFSFSLDTMAFFKRPALLVLADPPPGAGLGCRSELSSVLDRCCKGGLTSSLSLLSLLKRCRTAPPVCQVI